MSDIDIINSLACEPVRPPNHVSLDEIVNEVPYMDKNNPATYALYLHYNEGHLEEDEKLKVSLVIEKLKKERSAINKKNKEYMEREDNLAKVIEG